MDLMVLDDNHNVVPAADLAAWSRFLGKGDARTVAKATVGEARVSTVFLGIDHGFGGSLLWFETMVFGGPHDEFTDHYTTWDQAVAGHKRVVAALTEGREP